MGGSQLFGVQDHGTLEWLPNSASTTGKLVRWLPRLSDSEIYLVHRTGIENQDVDDSSRLKTGGTDTTTPEDNLPKMMVSFFESTRKSTEEALEKSLDLYFLCQH